MSDPTNIVTREATTEETALLYQETMARLNEALAKVLPVLAQKTFIMGNDEAFVANLRTVCGTASKLLQDIPGLLTQIGLLQGMLDTETGVVKGLQAKNETWALEVAKLNLEIERLTAVGTVDPRALLEKRGYTFRAERWHPPTPTHQVQEDEHKALAFLHGSLRHDLERP